MNNKYFNQYKNINRNRLFTLIIEVTQEGKQYERKYHILKVIPNADIISHALDIAKEKAEYTMAEDQGERIRTNEGKVLSAFRGVFAETAIQILFETVLNNYEDLEIIRYDIERETFEYKPEEYDVRIKNKNNVYDLEIRSSENYKYDLKGGLEKLDIIGEYTNSTKVSEEYSDYYVRPLYHYKPTTYKQEKNLSSYIDKLKKGEIILYITAGTDLYSMNKYSKIKNLGQEKTKYRCLWMQHPKAKDIKDFINIIKQKLK